MTMAYTIYNPNTGQIMRVGCVSNPDDVSVQAQTGEAVIEAQGNPATQYVTNDALVNMPPQPASYYTFDWPSKTWVIPINALTVAQSARSDYIDAQLEIAIANSTVAYNGNSYQVDRVSSGLITSTVTAVQAGIPLPTGFAWRTSNNINVPFAQADLVALGGLALQNTNTLYAHSWTQKALINAATTVDAVNAINW